MWRRMSAGWMALAGLVLAGPILAGPVPAGSGSEAVTVHGTIRDSLETGPIAGSTSRQ